MDTASLREFVVLVPVCVETETLVDAWQIFQQTTSDYVVVIDLHQMPLGLLRLRQLVRYFAIDRSEVSSQPSIGYLQHLIHATNAGAITSTFLEPLTPLPIDLPLDQLQPYLSEIGQRQWALVNASGEYVGLLDRLRLLQCLAIHSLPQLDAADPFPPLPPPTQVPIDPPTVLDPLIDLLERLPIPLMLQTTTGRVVTQNLAWRQQVEELRDPGQVRREAALILESIAWKERQGEAIGASPSPPIDRVSDGLPIDVWTNPIRPDDGVVRQSGSCRLGIEPNTCVCICPMKNGQDRVWKFLKIPMGIAPSHFDRRFDLAFSQASIETLDPSPASQFKLATLGFSPDPVWRLLAQTESLWLVLAQDTTEQHQVARELAAKNADLVQLNRLKDEFLACISHELKTPLTAVLGLSSLLKDHLLGELNERQSRYAQLIYQSGRHLILIVNDILDLTRIETGQLDLTLEPVQVEAVCLHAHEQARQMHLLESAEGRSAMAEGRSDIFAQFSLDIQPGVENLVADELRLRQMLSNLLSNALKFTPATGEIGLRVESWDGWIAFTVWDTGIGIPADKQHLIFQKFQQLENPLTRQFEGTGLGLVLTQRLAQLHGGDVTFTSVEGAGSQFTLLLPPSPPQAPSQAPQNLKVEHRSSFGQPTTITARNRLVIVVEATPQLIEELSRQLAGLGYRVAIARSGTEALEKIRRLQPVAVFLNPLLPMLSGWDVLTLLKADQETRHVPLIVTAMRVEKDQAYQNGADGFLSLPIQPESLRRCLDRLVSPAMGEAEQPSSLSLTVLHLYEENPPVALEKIHSLLYPHQCRVLEVDDLEQADLLARVWKPNVVLLGGKFSDPIAYAWQLSQYPFLSALPLVTLTPEITQAANQVPGLSLFPCLVSIATHRNPTSGSGSPEISALWQVIQMAAGISWTPHILVTDFSTLEENLSTMAVPSGGQTIPEFKASHSIGALVQYMQMAGFRSSIGHSWHDITRQLQHCSVDLWLLCVHSAEPHPLLLEIIQRLEQLEVKPPILVWNCQVAGEGGNAETRSFEAMWGAIATRILPPSLSITELPDRINQALMNWQM